LGVVLLDKNIREMVVEAAEEVFGTMYFVPIELVDEIPDANLWNLESSHVVASISFSGPLNGAVKFFFPASLARKIVAGFLGMDESEVSDSQALDTMGEAANMIIGSFLGKVHPEGACKLNIPASEQVNGFSPADITDDVELLAFRSEFGFLWMTYV
jgi:CheY-specific phosphatase CheX